MLYSKEVVIEKARNLADLLGRRPTKKDNSYLYFLSRKYFNSWQDLMKEIGYDVYVRQNPNTPDISLSEFYYFLGILCTDGHIQYIKKGGKYKLILFTSEIDERDMLVELLKFLFNYDASIRAKNYGFSDRNNYEVYLSSKDLCDYFIDLGIPSGAKSRIIKIPPIIFKVNEVNAGAFMRGVYDGDGTFISAKTQNIFKVSSVSKDFIIDIKSLLNKFGVNSHNIRESRNNFWELRVSSKEDIKNLYRFMYSNSSRFFYSRKRLKWENNIFKNVAIDKY